MASTPQFIISDAGLAAASVATSKGPFIEISSFAVGSAYGYTVESSDEGLSGNTLYSGEIATYSYVGDNTICIVCRLPADAGPFDFGEVALFLADGTMFAKAAFTALQTKYSSLGTNLAVTYTFNCLIKLEQSVAVFKITAASGQATNMIEVENWTDIVPAGLSSDPDVQSYIVKELSSKGDATLLIQSSAEKWTPCGTYYRLGSYKVQNASSTWVEIAPSDWSFTGTDGALSTVESSNSMVIETSDGFFRSVASIQHIGSPITGIRFLLNADALLNIPTLGDTVIIHIDDPALGTLTSTQGDSWSISITGNAATADYATRAGTADLAPAYMPLLGANFTGNLSIKDKKWPWGSAFSAIDFINNGAIASGAGMGTMLAQNLYHDGTTWHTKAAGVGFLFVNQPTSWAWYYTANAAAGAAVSVNAVLTVDGGGNLTAAGELTAFSDARLKANIQQIQDALTKVGELKGITYERIDGPSGVTPQRMTGLLAQDLVKVLPEAVLVDEKTGLMSVAYGNVVGLLVEAIKELRAEHADIKAELAELRAAFSTFKE